MLKQKITKIMMCSLLASAANVQAASTYDNDYDSALYQDEGRLLLKFRGFALRADGTIKASAPTSARGKLVQEKFGKFISSGIGAEAAAVLFLNDNFASELSLGMSSYKHKTGPMKAAAWNYSQSGTAAKNARLYMIPMSISMQYHIAPFGGVRPYVGGGYQYTYIHSNSKNFTTTNGHGPLVQAGVDFVMLDDTILNIDVRKSFYSSKLKYKKSMLSLGPNDASAASKYKVNPLQVAVGIGMKF